MELLPGNIHKILMYVIFCWGVMPIACLIDMWTGISKAKALKEKIKSRSLRCTVIKISEYWRVQIMAVLIDIIILCGNWDIYQSPYISVLFTIAIIAIEIWSVFENLREKKSPAGEVPEALAEILNKLKSEDIEHLKNILTKNEHNS